jgi:hypothetical protein
MTQSRPYLSKTGTQLNELFEASKQNSNVLHDLLKELNHRKTRSALALHKKVEMALNGCGSDHSSERKPRGEAEVHAPPPPPAQQTIQCRGCQQGLRILVRSQKAAYTCPECRAEFETIFRDGVLQVIWAETTQQATETMTEADARKLLSVSAAADFSAIKAAWRKACQEYHPDKHQGLPERLRRAAELEMKRINEAYRLLEGRTASDF